MAKDKSKDKLKADVVDDEIKNVSSKDIKNTDPKAKDRINKAMDGESKPAKAGKRSKKALEEQSEKKEKEAKKSEPTKKRPPTKPPRSKLERRGRNYREAYKNIDRSNYYNLDAGVELAIKTARTKFDSTIELHVRLNVDPKQADQNIRDSLILPAGTGKEVTVAVYCDESEVENAKSSGAKYVGKQEITKLIEKNSLNFDVLIATPKSMKSLSEYARILGPKGLMPSPKSGTVTNNVEKAVKDSLSGKVEYRVDGTGNVHVPIGKVSFKPDKIKTNLEAVLSSIKSKKPASIKLSYVNSAYLTTSMGPSIKLNISEI